MQALVGGEAGPATSLVAALRDRGLDAELHEPARGAGAPSVSVLAGAMVDFERRLEADRPLVAVAVGLGDVPVSLAVGAAKLGVPLAAWVDPSAEESSLEADERRILSLLSGLCVATSLGKGSQATEVAGQITAWADLD